MKKVLYTDEYKKNWNQFCLEQDDAWFYHTTHWMEYCLDSRFNVKTKNLSYLIMDDHKQNIMAIVPLIIERQEGISQFTYSGGGTPAPIIDSALSKKTQKKIERFIFEQYKGLAEEYNVQRIVLKQGNNFQVQKDIVTPKLVKQGYIDITIYTSVLPLHGEQEILSGMTKGHRSAIKSAVRSGVTVNIYDRNLITEEVFQGFQDSYFKTAGKVTRPTATFSLLYQFIKQGYGYLFQSVTRDGVITGYVYVIVYKTYAYYAMSCRNQSDSFVNSSEIIQWEIIRFLQQKNVLFYELGEQFFTPTLFYPVTEKIIAISEYKRGFGGYIVPQLIGEYIFSKEHFDQLWRQRHEVYINSRSDF